MTFRFSLLIIENKLYIIILAAEPVIHGWPVLIQDLKEIRMQKSAI